MISATDLDLLTFFETEPTARDEGTPWPYNDFAYVDWQNDFVLTFSVAPAYKDVRIVLARAEVTVYELNALSVEDVLYQREKGREILEIIVNSRDRLSLSLKPGVSIAHRVSENT